MYFIIFHVRVSERSILIWPFSPLYLVVTMFGMAVTKCLLFFVGEEVWRYVGKLTDAQRSMLDDRFKWKVCLYFTCINNHACVYFTCINSQVECSGFFILHLG